jgi:hypothetical protein
MRLVTELLAIIPMCCSSRGRYVSGREQRARGARLDIICTEGSRVHKKTAVATLRIYPDIFCAIIDRYWLCIRQRLVVVSSWQLAVTSFLLQAADHREGKPNHSCPSVAKLFMSHHLHLRHHDVYVIRLPGPQR